ncbi:MAG: methionine--tRNA ligase, partial [Spirochaetales bacterium]|nr:methionine--tRNA ligase [Spirochaetales bacterium]
WFNIAFDRFGRTSTPKHTEITQGIFLGLDRNGYITQKTLQQSYCEHDQRFLADRYIRGTCPACGYTEARGDQCENCGKLLDPTDLLDPRCGICGNPPVLRETTHLYIDLPAIRPKLEAWMKKASEEGAWARNAVQMTQAWIRDGLQERAITRDLKWGIPVPKKGFEGKVFYVWFDAPIGYISITANHTDQWESWWKNPDEVQLVQFIGKDNIPFHTVIFPCSLLGSGERWTMLNSMSSTEYLNYESGKFSKSKGVGVFGTDAVDSGIPADVWRFYLFYNRPERSDTVFTWKDFQEKANGELIGNLANLVNRTLTFLVRNFDGEVSKGAATEEEMPGGFWREVGALEEQATASLERAEVRDAFRAVFALSSLGNKRFQDAEPWKLIKEDRARVAELLRDLTYLIRDLAVLLHPFLPATAERIRATLGVEALSWDSLGRLSGIGRVGQPELLFRRLEDEEIEGFRRRFAGETTMSEDLKQRFRSRMDLRVGRITAVERHPKADKLYIETVDLGTETRQIVSGLVPYYREEELTGRNVILVTNLKPARLRGVESRGMLLAAEQGESVEVLFVDHGQPGDRVRLEGDSAGGSAGAPAPDGAPAPEIDIEEFASVPISVRDYRVQVAGSALSCGELPVRTTKVQEGVVH